MGRPNGSPGCFLVSGYPTYPRLFGELLGNSSSGYSYEYGLFCTLVGTATSAIGQAT